MHACPYEDDPGGVEDSSSGYKRPDKELRRQTTTNVGGVLRMDHQQQARRKLKQTGATGVGYFVP